MPMAKVILVSPSGWIHKPIVKTVEIVEKGPNESPDNKKYAHVAVLAIINTKEHGRCLRTIEALAPCVRDNDPDKYLHEPKVRIIGVPVTEEQLAKGEEALYTVIGKFYGLDDCMIGAFHDRLGDTAGKWAAEHLDLSFTIDCSAVGTVYFRGMGFDFLSEHKPCEITPEVFEESVLALPGAIDLSWEEALA